MSRDGNSDASLTTCVKCGFKGNVRRDFLYFLFLFSYPYSLMFFPYFLMFLKEVPCVGELASLLFLFSYVTTKCNSILKFDRIFFSSFNCFIFV